ncbi:MAG: polyprenyl synthetase family protein [Bacillota bacterium]|jgi:geranylgeranyl pyrophosphate synthase
MDTRALYQERLGPIVRRVEQALADCSDLDPEFEKMYWAAVGGGMRFRPCLLQTAFVMCGGEDEEIWIPAALAVELLHKASLIHDDLVDGDPLRRGKPSFCHVYGAQRAVIMGDLLVARAYRAIDGLEDLVRGEAARRARQRFVAAHYDMCRGELLELMPWRGAPTVDCAVRVISGKTASLMEQSLAIGAVLGGGNAQEIDALAKYGRFLGFIFQTVNDINNLTGFDSNTKGASLGDLEEQRVGFPMVGLAMQVGEERLAALSAQARRDAEGAKQAGIEMSVLLEEGPVRQWLEGILEDLQQEAVRALSAFPESFERHALESICKDMFESWFWEPD